MEGRLARGQASVLEEIARPDELKQLVPDILVGAPHIVDVEAPIRAFVAEHEGARHDARDGFGDIVVGKPERPEKSCAGHRFRHSSDSR
jgi:hypothetical protein